ncbi:hypothetical protein DL89DRAFT_119694 [Linderina pennispora]|uniref:Uncharacterized protein n=1 Tax=Linderina pennispora TaxID=61395 RepID=A0A1Y1WCJ2_9FUNG|nr:uncharacterized protein DL89DRAFT_119694 [Linderina pennispora]ORX71095.1 hypothetical protein DL89DRAFT_119694 [Linderina pennispora]
MTLFLLLPPNALALVNHKTLGEIIRTSNVEPRRFWLRPHFVTWFFFASDLFSIAMQGTGGGMSTSESLQTPAKAIALIGLCVQLVFFVCFFFIAVYVWCRTEYVVSTGKHDRDGAEAKTKVM